MKVVTPVVRTDRYEEKVPELSKCPKITDRFADTPVIPDEIYLISRRCRPELKQEFSESTWVSPGQESRPLVPFFWASTLAASRLIITSVLNTNVLVDQVTLSAKVASPVCLILSALVDVPAESRCPILIGMEPPAL